MTSFQTEKFEITAQLLAVRSNAAAASDLRTACCVWLKRWTEATVREDFHGSSLLNSQLDLFSKYRDQMYGIIDMVDAGTVA